ncbi:MAG: TRAP transporter substrate-binding protein DctP [Acidimicrobiia bacterium]|nr:TRAP transporter substrate-binding protein DctP [Acidimicrobiia bacterium]
MHPEEAHIDLDKERSSVSRRQFIRNGVGVAGFAAAGSLLAACTTKDDTAATTLATATTDITEVILSQSDLPEVEWQMPTSWPGSLIGTIGAGAQIFADEMLKMTGGKFKVTPRVAGELVGGLEVLPTVQNGGAEAGHTASYYYVGLSPAMQFGTAVPFGLTSRQQDAWLYEGGGLDVLREFYAEDFGLIQFPAGNTGVQMGGWFTKEINSVADLQGLKMRIPGLAGRTFNNLGAEQVTVAGGEIVASIETGAIDAAEWVGPYDDLILGLGQLGTKVYNYHPGWWEPGSTLEIVITLDTWNALPEEYQAAVENAAKAANVGTMAKYDVLNSAALAEVMSVAEIRQFPDDVLTAFKTDFEKVLDETAAADGRFNDILGPWREFRDSVQAWHALAETSMLHAFTL